MKDPQKTRFFRLATPVTMSLLFSAAFCRGVDHSHHWTGNTLTYNLVDLDNFPVQRYGYCKWGNELGYATLGQSVLSFDWLTSGPFGSLNREQLDLFLSSTETGPEPIYIPFPSNSGWQSPDVCPNRNRSGTVAFFQAFFSDLYLFRYHHFRNQLSDEVTGAPIAGNTKKAIILVHGWNPTMECDSYVGLEFTQLRARLLTDQLPTTDWKLITYHWEADADTGFILDGASNFVTVNATESAENAHQHGQHLGELLHETCSNLEKVHFITHSAGAWVARAATKFLLANNPRIVVQVTLLDPFVPAAIAAVNSSLSTAAMNQLASLASNERIFKLENYFADDSAPSLLSCDRIPDLTFTLGTQEQFNWRPQDVNLRVSWSDFSCDYYKYHAGPVRFYADSVSTTKPGGSIPIRLTGAPYDYKQIAWWRSLFFKEPLVLVQPQDQVATAGQSVTFTATVNTREGQIWQFTSAELTFQWRKNGVNLVIGGNVQGANSRALQLSNVQIADAGRYELVVSNSINTTVSRAATLIVNSTPRSKPYISLNGDLAFGTVPLGNRAVTSLTVANVGTADLLVTLFSYPSGFSVSWSGGAIPPGESRTATVTFAPTIATVYSGTLTVYSDDVGGNNSLPISGTGLAGPQPPIVMTGSASSIASTTATLGGNVNPNGTDTSIYFQYGTDSNLSSSQATPQQDVGARDQIVPASAPVSGLLPDTTYYYRIVGPASSRPGAIVSFRTLQFAPSVHISLDKLSVDFGTVGIGYANEQVIRIANPSWAITTLIGSVGTFSDPFFVVSGGEPFTLPPGQSTFVNVRFRPSSAGSFSASLQIAHNASDFGNPINIPLTGKAELLAAAIQVSPSVVTLDDVPVGGTAGTNIDISNPGTSALTISQMSGLSSPLLLDTPSLPITVAPGGRFSGRISIRFSPQAQGVFSQTLLITHNAGGPTAISVVGRTPITKVSVVPESVNFGSVDVGEQVLQAVTIVNESSSTGNVTVDSSNAFGTQSYGLSDLSHSGAFSINRGNVGSVSLSPGQSNQLTLRFAPLFCGAHSGSLRIHRSDAPNDALVVQLAGTCDASRPTDLTEVSTSLLSVRYGSIAWGDYDNDGDLDALLTGLTTSGSRIAKIYRNDGNGNLADIGASLPGVSAGSVAWADYNNDGKLDLIITGFAGSEKISKIYRNEGNGVFTDINAQLVGLSASSVACGDYNNDGRLDVALMGQDNGGNPITKIYRNDGNGAFTDISASLLGLSSGSVAWGDYDNDGNLDLLVSGNTGSADTTKIYRNNGHGIFADINAPFIGGVSATWGDYDNDGDLDILLAGPHILKVYRNDGNSVFTDLNAPLLQGLPSGDGSWSAVWGDYDNDGNLDILVTGFGVAGAPFDPNVTQVSKVYRNNGNGRFTDIGAWLAGSQGGTTVWGDFDGDGNLDIGAAGGPSYSLGKIYHNNNSKKNTNPRPPTNLSAMVTNGSVIFSWSKATDQETHADGLTYNLRVGTSPGIADVVSPISDATTGYHRLPTTGNVGHGPGWTLKDLSIGTYYWTVQTVDNGFAASAFAAEQSFQIRPTIFNPARDASGFTVTVQTCAGKNYTLEFKDSLNELSWSSGATLVGDGTFKTLTDSLATGSQRFYRVRAQ